MAERAIPDPEDYMLHGRGEPPHQASLTALAAVLATLDALERCREQPQRGPGKIRKLDRPKIVARAGRGVLGHRCSTGPSGDCEYVGSSQLFFFQ